VSTPARQDGAFSRRTSWARNAPTPLREFLRTETGGASVLLAAAIAALVWVNVDSSSYDGVWGTTMAVQIGDEGLALDLREWVNAGLMTFFFFVAGLEARREFDLGELRERRRLALPVLAAIGGMAAAVAIFLAFNSGESSARGWGIAMSTDTAFALGLLALFGSRVPDRLRAFILTVVVVDDLLALVVIATVYTEEVTLVALAVAAILFGATLVARAVGVRRGQVYFLLGLAIWVALHESGVEPVIVGLAFGLLTYAYTAPRPELDRVVERFRRFREQPTPELARSVREGLREAISPNDRLAQMYHPWTSYVIVPLFALANAGIAIDGAFLERAATSPITLGILVGYVIGKPVGIVGMSFLVTRLSRGRIHPPVGWAAVAGGGAIAGIGFTVALLVATLAFEGTQLEEAKLGILAAAIGASLLTWLTLAITSLLPERRRGRALLGSPDLLTDLAVEVDPDRDHIRGPTEGPVTMVEYGDFECPYCGRAEPIVRELLSAFTDVRYVWRHLPLMDVHPHAQLAAEAAEAAAEQGAFWEMHDLLLDNQDALEGPDLVGYAERLDLDLDRFRRFVREGKGVDHVADDVESADLSGVTGTPTFFINGRRHYGAYDINTLSDAVRAAGARAAVAAPPQ
jgi:Na+/H+ antiporter NhaA